MSSQDIIVRLRMLGAQAFNSAAKGASSAVRDIGQATEETSKKSKGFGNSLDRAGSALSGVWVMAGRAAAGLGAAGVAATGMGLKFNAGMEQSRVAFTNLLGSGEEANAMLDRLYKIAAHTPFEFPQLTQSTQRLLGFGMAAKDVIPTMSAVGDAVAAAGGGAEQIDRVSTALGQMQAKGKVSSEELLQLAESGVPALKILQDQLGLTGEELTKQLRDGAITADKGISALVRGMNKRYGGMAEAQSKTFSGMLSTLKDNATQLLGTVTLPLFTFLRDKVLPAVNRITEGISKWVKAGGIQQVTAALRAGSAVRRQRRRRALGARSASSSRSDALSARSFAPLVNTPDNSSRRSNRLSRFCKRPHPAPHWTCERHTRRAHYRVQSPHSDRAHRRDCPRVDWYSGEAASAVD
jgi:tape measure domain-containing protein